MRLSGRVGVSHLTASGKPLSISVSTMSQKITSKNLSYSTSLPPFLAALHAQAGNATGPDPLLARQRRAVKKRSASEEAEDVPLVVDELGNAVAVDVEKDGTVKEKETTADAATEEAEEDAKDAAASKRSEGKAEFGARKRKAGRVVGDDNDQESKEKTVDVVSNTASKSEAPLASDSKEKKPKKKAKKIKLSFDEED